MSLVYRNILPTIAFTMAALASMAQDPNSGQRSAARPGHQLILHTGIHVPWGELADRFGIANTVGIGWRRTANSGWRYGAQYRFQTGSEVREPGLLQNLVDPNGNVIDNEGRIALITPQQRGTLIMATIGRKWSLGARHPETGFIAEMAAGFWEHKVHFQNRGNRITQLEAPYLSGYDRLSGGWVVSPRIGMEYHSPNGQARFQVGLEALIGRLQPSRSWNADTGTVDQVKRNDRAMGIFVAWILRLESRSTVDYFY